MPSYRFVESVANAIERQEAQRLHVANRIEAAVNAGWSLRALAAELGVSDETLRVRVKRARQVEGRER